MSRRQVSMSEACTYDANTSKYQRQATRSYCSCTPSTSAYYELYKYEYISYEYCAQWCST